MLARVVLRIVGKRDKTVMIQGTTLEEARRLVTIAVRELPKLTCGEFGLHYTYHRQGKEAVALEIRKQQDELKTENCLKMVAFCVDWINEHLREIKPRCTSYTYKHFVEQWRRDAGDPDPYTCTGSFIAAAVGLGLD